MCYVSHTQTHKYKHSIIGTYLRTGPKSRPLVLTHTHTHTHTMRRLTERQAGCCWASGRGGMGQGIARIHKRRQAVTGRYLSGAARGFALSPRLAVSLSVKSQRRRRRRSRRFPSYRYAQRNAAGLPCTHLLPHA